MTFKVRDSRRLWVFLLCLEPGADGNSCDVERGAQARGWPSGRPDSQGHAPSEEPECKIGTKASSEEGKIIPAWVSQEDFLEEAAAGSLLCSNCPPARTHRCTQPR